MLNITVTNRKTNEKKSFKFTQNTILIGRQPNCDIYLESNTISRKHARILVTKNLIEIEDLGSGNGTVVNQNKIKSNDKALIQSGDKIRIEEFDIDIDQKDMVHIASITHKNKVDITDPDILEIKMIKKVLGALDHDKHPSLTVVSQEFNGARALFQEGMEELSIGRDDDCHLSISSSVVSRKHAVVTIKWGGFVITDLGSKNGTFVNGERVSERTIKDGDEIVFGTLKTIFKNPQEFDIEAITKSIEEEKDRKKKEEIQVVANKQEQQDKEAQQKETQNQNASASSQSKTETSKKHDLKKESAEGQKTAEDQTKQAEQKKPVNKLKGFLSSLSTFEKGLLGFGVFVILVVIAVLITLLGNSGT